MAVVAIAGDDLVARLLDRLHADRDGFLADVEVAEAADQAHAVELARPLLEPADEQHLAIEAEQLRPCRSRLVSGRFGRGRRLRTLGALAPYTSP